MINISKLTLHDGSTITDHKSILSEQRKFYENLYKGRAEESDFEYLFLNNNVPKISDIQKALCDKEITLEDCKKALVKMKTNKSPGTDGFPAEFYKYFWTEIDKIRTNFTVYEP